MTVYGSRKIVTVTWEYFVPLGSAVEELSKAGGAARRHYCRERGLPSDAVLPDDWATVTADDTNVIIRFGCLTEKPPER